MSFLSASGWLSQNRSIICGATGATGQTGPTGPAGPAGASGISMGAIYYNILGGPGVPLPPTNNYTLSKIPGLNPPIANPSYGGKYYGYFTEVVGGSGSPGSDTLIAEFTTLSADPNVPFIPPGFWNFSLNVYNFVQSAATTPSTIDPTVGVPSQVYAILRRVPLTGSPIQISSNVNRAYNFDGISDNPVDMSIQIPSGTTLSVTDRILVSFYIVIIAVLLELNIICISTSSQYGI
jgi:hypothetical protein